MENYELEWLRRSGLLRSGLRVRVYPLPLRLSEDVQVSPAFREEFDQWLLDTLGDSPSCHVVWSYDDQGDIAFVTREVMKLIQEVGR